MLAEDMLRSSKSTSLFISSCLLSVLRSFKFRHQTLFLSINCSCYYFSLSLSRVPLFFPLPKLKTVEISWTPLRFPPSHHVLSICSWERLLDSHLTYCLHCFHTKSNFYHLLLGLLHQLLAFSSFEFHSIFFNTIAIKLRHQFQDVTQLCKHLPTTCKLFIPTFKALHSFEPSCLLALGSQLYVRNHLPCGSLVCPSH